MSSADKKVLTEPISAVTHGLVKDALAEQQLRTSDETAHYLANLLAVFLRTDPALLDRTFGPALLEATSLAPVQRYGRLKEIADTLLFLSGIFLDYIEAKPVATEYFFEIGSSAYLHLGVLDQMQRSGGIAETYTDLGRRFADFVRVFSTISDRELFASDTHVLRLYRRWLERASPRDQRRLLALGLVPVAESSRRTH